MCTHSCFGKHSLAKSSKVLQEFLGIFFKGEGGRCKTTEDLIIIERVKTTLYVGEGGLGNKKTCLVKAEM